MQFPHPPKGTSKLSPFHWLSAQWTCSLPPSLTGRLSNTHTHTSWLVYWDHMMGSATWQGMRIHHSLLTTSDGMNLWALVNGTQICTIHATLYVYKSYICTHIHAQIFVNVLLINISYIAVYGQMYATLKSNLPLAPPSPFMMCICSITRSKFIATKCV